MSVIKNTRSTRFQLMLLTSMICFAGSLFAQTERLNIWLLPNELPLSTPLSPNQDSLFFRDLPTYLLNMYPDEKIQISSNIHVHNISTQLRTDPEFARWILAQKQIFIELDNFIRETSFNGEVWLRFFKWEQYFNRLSTISDLADAPDVVQVPTSWLAYLAQEEIITKLPNSVIQDARKRFFEFVLETCNKDGVLYALPWLIDVRLLFYHRNVFPAPITDLSDRETFKDALKQAHSYQEYWAPFVLPSAMDWDLLHQSAIFIWGSGGEILKSSFFGKQVIFGRKEGVDALQFLYQLADAGYLALPRENRYSIEEDFLNKRYGSMISGPWLMKRAFARHGRGWNENIGMALIPVGPGNRKVTFIGGSNLAITKIASMRGNQETVSKLHKFLTNDISLLRYSIATGHVPGSRKSFGTPEEALSYRDFVGQESFGTYLEFLRNGLGADTASIRSLCTALEIGKHYPSLPEWASKIETQATRVGLYNLYQNLADGEAQMIIEQDLKNVDKEINNLLVPTSLKILYVGGVLLFAGVILFVYWSWKRKKNIKKELEEKIRLQNRIFEDEKLKEDLIKERTEKNEQLEKYRTELQSLKGNAKDSIKLKELYDQVKKLEGELIPKDDSIIKLEKELQKSNEKVRRYYKGIKWEQSNLEETRRIAESWDGEWDSLAYEEFQGIVYEKRSILDKTITFIKEVAGTDHNILITGERGTGKELVARAIHNISHLKERPLVVVNMVAIPETIAESELFGHLKGAFTGATMDKNGLFHAADGGTLFLDEIGDISPAVQVKLLRAIEYGEIMRVGSTQSEKVKVRVIAATNRDLIRAMQEEKFRPEFFDRLATIQIKIPPLRERRKDILCILKHLYDKSLKERTKSDGGKKFDLEVQRALLCYHWPGNIREFKHIVERVSLIKNQVVTTDNFKEIEDFTPILEAYNSVFKPPIQKLVRENVDSIYKSIKPQFDMLPESLSPEKNELRIFLKVLWEGLDMKACDCPSNLRELIKCIPLPLPANMKDTVAKIIILKLHKEAKGKKTNEDFWKTVAGVKHDAITKWKDNDDVRGFPDMI